MLDLYLLLNTTKFSHLEKLNSKIYNLLNYCDTYKVCAKIMRESISVWASGLCQCSDNQKNKIPANKAQHTIKCQIYGGDKFYKN